MIIKLWTSRLVVTLCLLAVLLYGVPTMAQELTIGPFRIEAVDQLEVMRLVARQTGLNIGLEVRLTKPGLSKVRLEFAGGTSADLIEKVREVYPTASIQMEGRSLRISDSEIADAIGSTAISLLSRGPVTRKSVWLHVLSDNTMKRELRRSGCKERTILRGWEWVHDDPFGEADGTVRSARQLLDWAATQSNEGFWYIAVSDEMDECYVSIGIWE